MSDKNQTVEIIASGYEWNCPKCTIINELIAVQDSVICINCGREFEVTAVNHAE